MRTAFAWLWTAVRITGVVLFSLLCVAFGLLMALGFIAQVIREVSR